MLPLRMHVLAVLPSAVAVAVLCISPAMSLTSPPAPARPAAGLSSVLGLLKDTGQLNANITWSGRTNDSTPVALIGLEGVYTGGRIEERQARSVEAALTIKDEFGRVLTPKERFRSLCYE